MVLLGSAVGLAIGLMLGVGGALWIAVITANENRMPDGDDIRRIQGIREEAP